MQNPKVATKMYRTQLLLSKIHNLVRTGKNYEFIDKYKLEFSSYWKECTNKVILEAQNREYLCVGGGEGGGSVPACVYEHVIECHMPGLVDNKIFQGRFCNLSWVLRNE